MTKRKFHLTESQVMVSGLSLGVAELSKFCGKRVKNRPQSLVLAFCLVALPPKANALAMLLTKLLDSRDADGRVGGNCAKLTAAAVDFLQARQASGAIYNSYG